MISSETLTLVRVLNIRKNFDEVIVYMHCIYCSVETANRHYKLKTRAHAVKFSEQLQLLLGDQLSESAPSPQRKKRKK